jgi:hypothetical protein
MKFIGTLYGQIIIMSCLVVIYFLLWAISLFSSNCNRTVMSYMVIGSVNIFNVIYVILMVYDLILSFPFIRKCKIWELWKRDAFYFRGEFTFVLFVSTPLGFLTQIITRIPFDPSNLWPSIVTLGIINSVFFNAKYFWACGFALYTTILLWTCSLCRKKKKYKSNFDEVINHPEGCRLFEAFCKSEYSPENLWARQEIIAYRKNPTIDHATMIYTKYLQGSKSELEVNVTFKEYQRVKSDLASENHSNLLDSIFDGIFREVTENLMDTYARFVSSSEYIQFKKRGEYFNELITPLVQTDL